MRLETLPMLVLCGVIGVVVGHEHHGHDHDHAEKEIPLHEQEYIQDNTEELERKWGFEVRVSLHALKVVGSARSIDAAWHF